MDGKKLKKQRGLRSDNRVQVTLTVGRKPDGSPNKKSFYGTTRSEAEKKRDEYKLKMRMGLIVNENVSVSEWVDTCLSLYRQNVNEAYIVNDSVPYNRLKREIGRMPVANVREADLQNLLNKVSSMSYSTVNKYYQAIKLVFDRARRNKIIFDNPADNLQMPKCEKGSHRALERWETDCILKNWQQHRCGIWAMLMLLCGLRRGEMMALTWEDIDMEKKQLSVSQVAVIRSNQSKIEERAKTAAGIRVLPICKPLWDCLSSVPKENRHGLVCTTAEGKQISSSGFKCGWDGFNLAMQRLLNGEDVVQKGRRVKLEHRIEEAAKQGREYVLFSVRAHDLRHTFATALYDANVDVKSAQYYLGHADIRMTLDLYTHLSKERQESQRSQLVSFLDVWLKPISMYEQNEAENEDIIL